MGLKTHQKHCKRMDCSLFVWCLGSTAKDTAETPVAVVNHRHRSTGIPPRLWAILQLDQCIMCWHVPSLCADSSVTLGDPLKYMGQVSQSPAGQQPLTKVLPYTELGMVPVPSSHEETQEITSPICWYLTEEHVARDESLHTSNNTVPTSPWELWLYNLNVTVRGNVAGLYLYWGDRIVHLIVTPFQLKILFHSSGGQIRVIHIRKNKWFSFWLYTLVLQDSGRVLCPANPIYPKVDLTWLLLT